MTPYYYIGITFFAVIAYLMIVDRNIVTFIELSIRFAGIQLKRSWWIIKLHPSNPITKWIFNRRIERMTKQLEKDLQIDTKRLTDDQ